MSTSLVVGVLITIGVIALLVVAGLLTSGRRSETSQAPVAEERPVRHEESRANGVPRPAQEQMTALAYPSLSAPRDPLPPALQRERTQEEERQEDLQARYEKTLQELMTLLQQEQRPATTPIALNGQEEEDSDPYRVPRPHQQIEDARQERSMVSSQPETVQAHYSMVSNNEEARKKLPGRLSIPVSIEVDGDVELERIPRMRIEVVIHLQ